MKVQDEGRDFYVLVAYGDQQYAYQVAKIEVNQLEALILAYKENGELLSMLSIMPVAWGNKKGRYR